MKRLIFVLPLLLALPTTAHADPKEITIDGCAKVQQEVRKDHDRTTITVKCTGESFDPEVRKSQITGFLSPSRILTVPDSYACVNASGKSVSC